MRALAVAFVVALSAESAVAGWLDRDVSLNVANSGLQSFAFYQWIVASEGEPVPTSWSQYHGIVGTGAEYVGNQNTTMWSHSLASGYQPQPPNCYRARLTVTYTLRKTWTPWEEETFTVSIAAEQCFYGPPAPPTEPLSPNAPTCGDPGQCSPIVLNLGRGAYRLSGLDDPVTFDLSGEGRPVRTGWTARGTPLAFLALDRNGNGFIDSGSELFGNATRLASGQVAPNGFVALAELDDVPDGTIDNRDTVWRQLLLWTDGNHDGVSDPRELQPIEHSGVTALGLVYHYTGRDDHHGNSFRYQALATRDGQRRPVYDIWFITASN